MPSRPLRGLRGEHVYLRPMEPEGADLLSRWYSDDRMRKLIGDLPASYAARRARYETAGREDGEAVYGGSRRVWGDRALSEAADRRGGHSSRSAHGSAKEGGPDRQVMR